MLLEAAVRLLVVEVLTEAQAAVVLFLPASAEQEVIIMLPVVFQDQQILE
jgi:hypothetical protein